MESEYEGSLWASDASLVCVWDMPRQSAVNDERENMTELKSSESARASGDRAAVGRLFVLELSGNRVFSVNPDGSDRKVIVTECRLPDGIAVDVEGGHIYWTNMGVLQPERRLHRARRPRRAESHRRSFPRAARSRPNSSSSTRRAASCTGATARGCASCARTSTGRRSRLSWRRAGATLDRRDQTKWCVGIAVDAERGQIYWTQKGPDNAGLGRIFRANIELPTGQSASNRTGHRSAVRRPARADRSGARSEESPPVLDRPRRPAARQHGQPRPDGRGSHDARRRPRSCSRT